MIQTVTKKGVVLGLGAGGEIDSVATANYALGTVVAHKKIFLYYGASTGGFSAVAALAVSDDGMNFVKKGVIVGLGAGGTIDDNATAYGELSPFFWKKKLWMYYSSYDGTTGGQTALATSDDGMNFLKKGVVVPIGGGGSIDSSDAQGGRPLALDDKVWLYYSALVGTTRRVALAVSDDGMNFVKKGVVVGLGGVGEIDDDSTSELGIAVCRHGDKIWIFSGVNDGTTSRIAAHVSSDGLNFVKKGVIVGLGGGGEIDDAHSGYNLAAISHNDKLFLYYGANDGSNTRTALAVLS